MNDFIGKLVIDTVLSYGCYLDKPNRYYYSVSDFNRELIILHDNERRSDTFCDMVSLLNKQWELNT